MTTEEKELKMSVGKQTLKKQITCGFELEKLELAQKNKINRTNSYVESDEFIMDCTALNKYSEPNQNNNHLGHCGNNVNLNVNFSLIQNQLHRSEEYENLTEKGLNENEQDKLSENNSHLKRTDEVESLINNEVNNDD